MSRPVSTMDRELLDSVLPGQFAVEQGPSEDRLADAAVLPLAISQQAVRRVKAAFSLTAFETDLLLWCVACALDGDAAAAASPTFRHAMQHVEGASGEVLSWSRPLRFWSLLETGEGSLLDAPLRASDRVMLYLLGVPAMEERLDGICTPMAAADPEVEYTHQDAAARCADHWAADAYGNAPVLLVDGSATGRARLFRSACRRAGLQPWEMHPANLPADAAERARIGRLWAREAVLLPAALLIHPGTPEEMQGVKRWLDGVEAPIAIDARDGLAGWSTAVRVSLPSFTVAERVAAWQKRLGAEGGVSEETVADLAESFPMEEEQIAAAAKVFGERKPTAEEPARLLRHVCREQARRAMDQLATRVESNAEWSDLILPEAQDDVLRQMLVQARETHTVHQAWGFAERYQLGLGLAALFAGASGTGKTMAAGILARELDRDLYQIDLSATVSKYIGETEERLRRIFDTAEQSGAILLFDEADALFGKRTQVKDSHDRYANLEVSYLLQRVETYRGIVILTTNMQHAMDQAFVRRLRFVVQFPLPGVAEREKIWRGIFPAAAPVAQLDYPRLAQLNVPGGVIRNVAFHAAFLAAGERTSIGMEHLMRSARAEFGKMDRPMNAAELRGWV